MVGIIELLSASMGKALNEAGGRLMTRLTSTLALPPTALGSIQLPAMGGADIVDGQRFRLHDGLAPIDFEFDSDASVVPTTPISTTVISGTLSASATTIPAALTTGFPTFGTLLLGQEYVTYTGLTAFSFTGCIRGADGTTAASHPNASVIQLVALQSIVFTTLMTQAALATATQTAVNAGPSLGITAAAPVNGFIRFTNDVPGPAGNQIILVLTPSTPPLFTVTGMGPSMAVETTIYWQENGFFYLDGSFYRYTGKTPVSLEQVAFFDETGFAPGFFKAHLAEAMLFDWTKAFSQLDNIRRGTLVDFAEGPDLDVVGNNLGVKRPSTFGNDDIWRRMLKSIAYTHRGTIKAIRNFLEVYPGAGNFEIFQDIQANPGRVYFGRKDQHLSVEGKTVLLGANRLGPANITDNRHIVLPEDARAIRSVQLADEGGRRMVAKDGLASRSGPKTLTFSAVLPYPIQENDIISFSVPQRYPVQVGDEAPRTSHDIAFATVLRQTSPIDIEVKDALPAILERLPFRIYREGTNCHWARPSTEGIFEYDADPGSNPWTYTGASEVTDTTVVLVGTSPDIQVGDHLGIRPPGGGGDSYYEHLLRAQPYSDEIGFEFQVRFPVATDLAAGALTGAQAFFELRDGANSYKLGAFQSAITGLIDLGFITAAGALVSLGVFISIPENVWRTFRLVRLRDRAELRDEMGVVLLSLFPQSSPTPVDTTAPRLRFGCQSGTGTGPFYLNVRRIEYFVHTTRDFWNVVDLDGSCAGTNVTSSVPIFSALLDVGRLLRIRRSPQNPPPTPLAFSLGEVAPHRLVFSPEGEWPIVTVNSTTNVDVGGMTQEGAYFNPWIPPITATSYPVMRVRGLPRFFRTPEHRGMQIEILDGPNAGIRTIVDVLDPVTLFPVAEEFLPGESDTVRLSGGALAFDDEANWRLLPVFDVLGSPTDPLTLELVGTGTFSTPTLELRTTHVLPFITGPRALYDVSYATEASAFALYERTQNSRYASIGTPLANMPMYMSDPWGQLADVIDTLVAGGVIADFDHFIRDVATGPHLRG